MSFGASLSGTFRSIIKFDAEMCDFLSNTLSNPGVKWMIYMASFPEGIFIPVHTMWDLLFDQQLTVNPSTQYVIVLCFYQGELLISNLTAASSSSSKPFPKGVYRNSVKVYNNFDDVILEISSVAEAIDIRNTKKSA